MNMTLWNKNPLLREFGSRDFGCGLEDLNRLMSRLPGGLTTPFDATTRLEGFAPAIDVSENDDEFTIRAEIPGISPRDLEITITGTTLNFSGKKEEKEETESDEFYRCERRFGSFRRSIELPETADAERVNADTENGVVTIRIAKKPGLRTRRVEVKPTSRRVPVPT